MATAGQWNAINQVLEQHEMLLVHFNTPMSQIVSVGYPNDLQYCVQNPHIWLCASTFGKQSVPPIGHNGLPTKDASSVGMIGLILDLPDTSTIHGISDSDAGSNCRDKCRGLTQDPDVQIATKAVQRSTNHDEWVVENAVIKGVLFLHPPIVSVPDTHGGRRDIQKIPQDICADFPGMKIFAIDQANGFLEYNCENGNFIVCTYQDIMA